MSAVEVMTSESQERMLVIVQPDDLAEVLGLCERWEIDARGHRVTDSRRFRMSSTGCSTTLPRTGTRTLTCWPLADVPVESLGDGPRTTGPGPGPRRRTRAQAAGPGA